MQRIAQIACGLMAAAVIVSYAQADNLWVTYKGHDGPGKGKHVVLVSGDEEYRSEEALPQLGKILSVRHGFDCTVLFAIDKSGLIDPNTNDNIPGLEALDSADLLILFTRFRNLPDAQMEHFAKYLAAGKPVIGMRTATHAFSIPEGRKFRDWSWDNSKWSGGFGRQVLGETWISHHGQHGAQSTRGILAPNAKDHPILRGLKDGDIWGPTDVYGVTLPLPGDSKPLVLGQVLQGMHADDKPVEGKVNEPMMPVAWVKSYVLEGGKKGQSFTTTMGASQDLENAGVRRMLVNACYWAVGLADQIKPDSNVELVGSFKPLPFHFNGAAKGVKPSEHAMKE